MDGIVEYLRETLTPYTLAYAIATGGLFIGSVYLLLSPHTARVRRMFGIKEDDRDSLNGSSGPYQK